MTQVAGTVTLAVAGFVDIHGAFAFEKTETVAGTVTTTKIKAAVADVDIFLGANAGQPNEMGVKVTDANMGLVMTTVTDTSLSEQAPAKYALVAGGTAALVGIDGLTLSGSLAARVNRTGAPVDETITTPGGDVAVKFDSGRDVTQVAGTVTLAVAGFVDIHGAFAFEKTETVAGTVTTTKIKAAVADVDIFLGANAGQPNEMGVKVTDANMGLVMTTVTDTSLSEQAPSKYALVAGGTAALVGIDGLTLSGSLSARVNRTGAPVDETITTPGGDVAVKFDSGLDVTQVAGTVTLAWRASWIFMGRSRSRRRRRWPAR